jgi:hypothetical protein
MAQPKRIAISTRPVPDETIRSLPPVQQPGNIQMQMFFFSTTARAHAKSCTAILRLRALRVEVDVKLALGLFTIEDAAEYLRTRTPMDVETARYEAVFFASTPGQAITYQIGKLQIIKFLAEARQAQGAEFSLALFMISSGRMEMCQFHYCGGNCWELMTRRYNAKPKIKSLPVFTGRLFLIGCWLFTTDVR